MGSNWPAYAKVNIENLQMDSVQSCERCLTRLSPPDGAELSRNLTRCCTISWCNCCVPLSHRERPLRDSVDLFLKTVKGTKGKQHLRPMSTRQDAQQTRHGRLLRGCWCGPRPPHYQSYKPFSLWEVHLPLEHS